MHVVLRHKANNNRKSSHLHYKWYTGFGSVVDIVFGSCLLLRCQVCELVAHLHKSNDWQTRVVALLQLNTCNTQVQTQIALTATATCRFLR